MKHGLVMEGGAMRGLFTAGVIDVMMEEGIGFDGAIGVSAGAVFGSNYKSNQPGRVIRYNLRFCQDPRYSSFRSLAKTGDLFGADFCYRRSPITWTPLIGKPTRALLWIFTWWQQMSTRENRFTTTVGRGTGRTWTGSGHRPPCPWRPGL